MALRRVTREIAICNQDGTTDVRVELVDDSPFHLRGSFQGPQDTPYEGGYFELDIVIPNDYPFRPPKVKFITKVYHPNISFVTGAIFVDILSDQWHPTISLQKLLLSLQSFLCSPELCGPEPDEPQDVEVAKQFASSRQTFEDTARTWTHIYAKKPYP